MSISKINKLSHNYQLRKYMVDEISVDWEATYQRESSVTKVNEWSAMFVGTKNTEVEFYDPIVHWTINGYRFSGAVPIQVYSVVQDGIWIQRTDWYEDVKATEKLLGEMIERSRKLHNPSTCPECNGKGRHSIPQPTIGDFAGNYVVNIDDIRCKTCDGSGVQDGR